MAQIRIVRNEAANCITFQGTSVPAYFNACLSGEVSPLDPEKVDVKNDIRSNNQQEDFYEFSNIHYTRFEDRDGNSFASAQDVADYITKEGNVLGLNDVGKDLTGENVNFRLDQTSTSIIMNNGESFGVNTIKAVPDGGLIKIKSIGEGIPTGSEDAIDRVHFENLDHTLVQVNGSSVSGGLNDVVDTLNELFTVGAFEAVVIRDPDSTTIADVNGVTDLGNAVGNNAIDPLGDDILGTTATHNNAAGYLSDGVIDQAGEYFTFDIAGKATYGFGLVHTQDSYDDGYYLGNASYADPSGFCVGPNSSHLGYQFSHHFHIGNAHASWTNYGANTAYVMGEAWYDHNNSFNLKEEWNNGDPVKVKVGINDLGFITISTLADDGVNWKLHARSAYPVPQGSSFKLGVKLQTTGARLRTQPKIHLLEPAAPTMYFRYIESPDGNYDFPLFASSEEANYYDTVNGGTGESTNAVYPDDPTNTSWFVPVNGFTNDNVNPPNGTETFENNIINWSEITSLTDSDLVPPVFSGLDYTFDEGQSVNIQVSAQDVSYTTTVSGLPQGLTFSNGFLISGTTRHVYGDQTYTISVTRSNSYGSSTGNFDLTIVDDVAQNAISGYTIYGQNPITQSPNIIHHYSGAVNLDLNLTLDVGTELIWTQQNNSPIGGQGQYLQIGIANNGIDKMTTQLGNNTADWQVKAVIWTGTLNHNYATGWSDASSSSYSGSNNNIQWKLSFPTDNAPIELYRDGVLVRTSSSNFSGSQTVTVGVPVAYTTTTKMPDVTKANVIYAGDPPSGFNLTNGSMLNSTTLDSDSVVTLDTVLPTGKRMIVNKSWVETNVLPNIPNSLQKAYIGVPKLSANWSSIDLHNDFDCVMRWEGSNSSASHKSTLADGSDIVARHESSIGSSTNAYYHYAIEWDGVNLCVLADTDISKFSNEHDYNQFNRYSCYENYTDRIGDLPIVMATKTGGNLTLTEVGISFVDIPSAPVTILTPWTKALDFSGSNQHALQVYNNNTSIPMRMGGGSSTVSDNNDVFARPWATVVVFRTDVHNSNQHIWNMGEGTGGDNIYLRVSASGSLHFGWGRDGSLNECSLGNATSSTGWHGVYIAHDGTRLNGSNATSSNLASAFNIRRMGSEWSIPFGVLGSELSIPSNWVTNGGRMDRSILGNMTIGGRGSNRSFHGKIASFITTTLKRSTPLPSDSEIETMITDPIKWLNNYKIGQSYRETSAGYNNSYFQLNDSGARRATQIWLMGDGNMDSYSNMIRNIVDDYDQNYTKLNLISMVSNDIQNVNINGLT